MCLKENKKNIYKIYDLDDIPQKRLNHKKIQFKLKM